MQRRSLCELGLERNKLKLELYGRRISGQRERERERSEVVVIAWIGGLFLGLGRGGARVEGARGREAGTERGGRDDEG